MTNEVTKANEAKKEAYVLIKIKSISVEIFSVMVVACKELCERTRQFEPENLAEITEVFSVFGPFDFILELSAGGEEKDKKINKTIFKIRETLSNYIDETCTLTTFELAKCLKGDGKSLFEGDGSNLEEFKPFLEECTFNKLDIFKSELDYSIPEKHNPMEKIKNQVYVLIRVKPVYTQKFLVAMRFFERLCNKADPLEDLAKISEIRYTIGPFDFLLKIRADNEYKINKTIFKIRETLGDYINETLTIEKIKTPIKKEELNRLFKKKLGQEYIIKLPNKSDGKKIPNEHYESEHEINLNEIYDAETTTLENLLGTPDFYSEPEILNGKVADLNDRIEKIEQKLGIS